MHSPITLINVHCIKTDTYARLKSLPVICLHTYTSFAFWLIFLLFTPRLHGGPSGSPCLMPFINEQRLFLFRSPESKAQLYTCRVKESARGQATLHNSSQAPSPFLTPKQDILQTIQRQDYIPYFIYLASTIRISVWCSGFIMNIFIQQPLLCSNFLQSPTIRACQITAQKNYKDFYSCPSK